MRTRSWVKIVWTLAAAGLVVCGVFFRVLGPWHLAAIAGLAIVAPLALAALGGRVPREGDAEFKSVGSESQPTMATRPRYGIIAAGFAIACVKFGVLGFVSSRFVPALHDEWSYLFGAQTFAAGRLTNPTPRDAEFFDAFHIVIEPNWVTRYPPGHPAALALGVVCGMPWLVPVLLSAGTVVCTCLLGRLAGGERAGWFAAILAILSPGLDYLASGYLSQSTFLFAITGCFVCVMHSVARDSAMLAAAGGIFGGWAILTRPYSAAAFGAPLAVWFVVRLIRHGSAPISTNHNSLGRANSGRCVVAGIAPVVVAVGLFAGYNYATTGSSLRTAWGEYNRQFEPDNWLGFGGGTSRQIPDSIHFRKRLKAEQIAREQQAFTWQAAVTRAFADRTRISQMAFPALGFYGLLVFLPFACGGDVKRSAAYRAVRAVYAAAIVAHYLAYSLFYARWGAYGQETIPFVIALVACGLESFWQRSRDSERPMLVVVAPLTILAAFCLDAFVQVPRFIAQRAADTAEHRRFAAAVREPARRDPLLVFVQFDPAKPAEYDLINNSPALTGRVVVALDFGEQNARLVRRFPERRAFVYELVTGTLHPWIPPSSSVPARPSVRPAPEHATPGSARPDPDP